MKLPNGIHTLLVKGGQNLSVVQNLRLFIVQVFLKKPKIAVLDEVTSLLNKTL